MAYEVTHHTEYHYPSTVSSSFGEIVMLPRELAGQACLRSELTIEPAPHDLRERLDACQFVLDSPLVTSSEQLAEYATPSFPPGRPLLASVVDLSSRIHRDFEFLPGVTEVKTTIEEVFARRAGVCQDFAHVAIGCLRSLGLAARYVSGYLETRPAPGRARLAGADVSHAWVSVFLPGAGWADVDPTNDQLVN